MGKLFGGSTESEIQIPEWLQEAAKSNLGKAQDVASLGYTPYYGADVAAFNPMQQQGFQNTADASRAFGLSAPTDAMAGMPQAQDFGGGVMGYSSQPLFQDAINRFGADRPAQKSLLDSFFIDPQSGQVGSGSLSQSGVNAPIQNTGGVAMDQAQQAFSTPVSPSEVYNQQEQQQMMMDELAQAGQSPQVPSDFMQNMNTLYPEPDMPQQSTIESMSNIYQQPQQDLSNITVDSFSQAGAYQPDYGLQGRDPTLGEQVSYGAEALGRGLIDNSVFGGITELGNRIAPDSITSNSLSDMIFGQQAPMSYNSLGSFGGTSAFGNIGSDTFGNITKFLDDTKQYGKRPAVPQFETITVNDSPTLTAPSSFINAGNMLDQSAASQSPIKNLFDSLDAKKTRDKEIKGIQRNFNRMR